MSVPSIVPQKRSRLASEDGSGAATPNIATPQDHTPAISSPLKLDSISNTNGSPTAASSKPSTPTVASSGREPREKKDSLKKREANEIAMAKNASSGKVAASAGTGGAGSFGSGGPGGTGDGSIGSGEAAGGSLGEGKEKSKKTAGTNSSKRNQAIASPLPLLRYHIPRPKPYDFEKPTPPIPVLGLVINGKQYHETTEHVWNRKGFRYIHCIADPGFPAIQYHRQSETEPFHTRFDYSDCSQHIQLDQTARCVTTEKGFRMARANVCAREGRWYWECRVLNGIKQPGDGSGGASGGNGHVRMGFSRREASLETPVGFDAYSYGLRDALGQKVHMSRPKDFMPEGEEVREGDVIGCEINLPSLALHRKVAEGAYNKAVDVSDDVHPEEAGTQDIIRDRLPIRYKSHLYFESFEYQSVKELEDLMNPSLVVTTGAGDKSGANKPPHANHHNASMRTLPHSSIKIYKNGKLIGIPFTDLLAFLPPASKPVGGAGQISAREGLDDGMLGYFPSVSVFRGGAAEANFGPDFWYPPPEMTKDVEMENGTMTNGSTTTNVDSSRKLRPLAERFDEQIAEDIVYDIIDEVDLWSADLSGDTDIEKLAKAPPLPGPVDPSIPEMLEDGQKNAGEAMASRPGEIKEIVQDDE